MGRVGDDGDATGKGEIGGIIFPSREDGQFASLTDMNKYINSTKNVVLPSLSSSPQKLKRLSGILNDLQTSSDLAILARTLKI